MDIAKLKFNSVVTDNGKASIQQIEGRTLLEGEMLIRVEACPINPSDQYMALGFYGAKELMNEGPLGVGFEGAGVVTQVSHYIQYYL